MFKRFLNAIGWLIENKKGIRRLLTLSVTPIWLWLTIIILKDKADIPDQMVSIYNTFSAVVGVIVGFYFASRRSEDNLSYLMAPKSKVKRTSRVVKKGGGDV